MAGRRSPWGKPRPDEGDGEADTPPQAEGEGPKGPRNPWLPPGGGEPRRSATIEDIFRGGDRRRPGGGGGGFPRLPERPDGKSWFPLILGGIALLWLGVSTIHMVGPKEEGVVTTFGKYSRTIGPGVSLTMPWPVQSVDVADVTSIKVYTIPEGENEKLMLTATRTWSICPTSSAGTSRT